MTTPDIAPVEVIRIVFTTEDVYGMADECEPPIDHDVALERALEWGRYIADTASSLCAEQLGSVIEIGQP